MGDGIDEAPQRWTVGDVRLTALVESEIPGGPAGFFFPDPPPDDVLSAGCLYRGVATPDGGVTFRVQAFVVEVDGSVVLVDPCVGNGKQLSLPFWNDLALPWLDQLAAAGFDRHGIDLVVHTHLHEDHIGWDTHRVDGQWTPTFPNATHVYVDAELDFARSPDRRTGQDPFAESISPVLDAGLGQVVGASAELLPRVRLVPTPGHTPGHASLRVETGAEPIVVSGDLLHHQFQLAHPHLREVADWNPAIAVETRKAFLDEHARSGAVVAGTHFGVAPLGRIEADGPSAWRFRSI